MKKMTEEFLLAAFAGESQAHMKYLNFAKIAEKEGFPNIARLFRAISYAEEVHASAHLQTLGAKKTTVENLASAIGGETFEVENMYPAYIAVAEVQKETKAKQSFDRALEAEKIHQKMYSAAKTVADQKKDTEIKGKIYICPVCGWTSESEDEPDQCPVCKYKGEFPTF